MRYPIGFILVLALGVMGCGETTGDPGGNGGTAGTGGTGGDGGSGGGGGAQALCERGVCPCSEAGIRAAVAEGGGYFRFACRGLTTVVTEDEIVIEQNVRLDGENRLTIDGDDSHRVLSVEPGASVELRRLTVQRGASSDVGAGVKNAGRLTVREIVVSNNTAASHGGGIWNLWTLHVRDSAITGNVAGVQDCGPGQPCRFGGGIWNAGELVVERTVLSGNRASTGGAIFNQAIMRLADVSVTENTTPSGSGSCGAGVHNRGEGIVTGSSFTRNSAVCGAAFSNHHDILLTDVTIADNSGGGFYNSSGTAVFIRSTVSNNSEGSGILSHGQSLTLVNSTVSGNSSTDMFFGGIDCVHGLRLINSTVSGNMGGGISVGLNATIAGSIIDDSCDSFFDSEGGNLESPGNSCGLRQPTDQVNVASVDLKLESLADNGGQTETHALGVGSVAIDVIPTEDCVDADGEPLTTDQRGYARPYISACDAGSLEHGSSEVNQCPDPSGWCGGPPPNND